MADHIRTCTECRGTGASAPKSVKPCSGCGGTGEFIFKQGSWRPFNPHNSLTRVDKTRNKKGKYINHTWRCTYCNLTGPYKLFEENDCSYKYPPCKFCGHTPFCTLNCEGVRLALTDPNIGLLGAEEIIKPDDYEQNPSDLRLRTLARKFAEHADPHTAMQLSAEYLRNSGVSEYQYIDDMEVASFNMTDQDWYKDPSIWGHVIDWISDRATFTHRDTHEHIFYIPYHRDDDFADKFEDAFPDCPTEIRPAIEEARNAGFAYICFYAD